MGEFEGRRPRALNALPQLPEVVVPDAAFDWYQPGEAAQLLQTARDPWERALLMFALQQNPVTNQLTVCVATAARQPQARKALCSLRGSRAVHRSDDEHLLFDERRIRVV